MNTTVRVILTLRTPAGDPDAVARFVRAALKLALRTFRLRCVAVTWAPAHEVDRSATANPEQAAECRR